MIKFTKAVKYPSLGTMSKGWKFRKSALGHSKKVQKMCRTMREQIKSHRAQRNSDYKEWVTKVGDNMKQQLADVKESQTQIDGLEKTCGELRTDIRNYEDEKRREITKKSKLGFWDVCSAIVPVYNVIHFNNKIDSIKESGKSISEAVTAGSGVS
jgi:molecular chaperone GrpE (heat shock protein)